LGAASASWEQIQTSKNHLARLAGISELFVAGRAQTPSKAGEIVR
jgi:hypothetical protein